MALGNRVRATYLQITKGKLRHYDSSSKQTTEYEEVSGRITGITFATREKTANQKFPNHEEICLTMQDGGEIYKVTCTAKTGAGRGLMKQLPSIDPNEAVVINLSYEEEFKATTVFFKQRDQPVKWHWSKVKGNIDELPEGVKYIDPQDGEEKTQYNDQTAMLKEYVLANVRPNLMPVEPEQSEKYDDGVPDFDEGDDAPF
jgi:hypothetical protein